MNRRFVTLVAVLFPAVVLLAMGFRVTVPYIALGPGPTFDTLGTVDDKSVVAIEGTETDPTSGRLLMTTVGVADGLTMGDAFRMWLSDRYSVVPREEYYPPQRTKDEVRDQDAQLFAKSERDAQLAAMRFLDEPVSLTVGEVTSDAPASGVLRTGDNLTTVDGAPVVTADDVVTAVAGKAPGTPVQIGFRRDGVDDTADVVLAERPGHPDLGYLGIVPVETPEVPFTVQFNLADVGGPSAGLMFSLAVVDKLSPGELSNGGTVAGTGTILSSGVVGPIGGITHKLTAASEAGATVFLVPAANCAEALTGAPDGMRLVKVDTLTSAVDSLTSLGAGGDAPSCSADER